MKNGLTKNDRLCSRTAINLLFESGRSYMGFPLRVVARATDAHRGAQFLISIPKKRIRTAVERVRLRRLVREAYRLHRHNIMDETLASAAGGVDLAFVYVDNQLTDYRRIESRVISLLSRVAQDLKTDESH